MIGEITSQIKNYAIISEYGMGGPNITVTLIPIEFGDIPQVSKLKDIDGIVRFYPNGQIYRLQIQNIIYNKSKEINGMAKILGLHEENKVNWRIGDKKFNFETGGFEG